MRSKFASSNTLSRNEKGQKKSTVLLKTAGAIPHLPLVKMNPSHVQIQTLSHLGYFLAILGLLVRLQVKFDNVVLIKIKQENFMTITT